MPIHGSQVGGNFGEKLVWETINGIDASIAIPINEIAQELIITEIGIQLATLTGTSVDIDLFQANDLNHALSDPTLVIGTGAGEITNVMDPGAAYQLTSIGTVLFRPNGAVLVTSDYAEPTSDKQMIQLQLRATYVAVTTTAGSWWMKYYVRN